MRICHAIFSNPWSRLAGGGQLAVHEIACAMAELGHEVHAIYSRSEQEAASSPALPYAVRWTRYREVGGINLDFIAHALQLYSLLASRRFGAVFCHGENGALFPALCAAYATPLHGVLHASRLSDRRPWYRWEFGNGQELNYRLLNHLLGRCGDVHVFSAFSAALAETIDGPIRPRIHRATPGVDKWVGCYRTRQARAGGGDLVGICWSRLEAGKGHAELIDGFASLRAGGMDARLILIGDGTEAQEIRTCAEAALGSAATFTGNLSPAQIRHWLLEADVAVFPSKMESFGLAAAEAAAAGIPTFAADVGGMREALAGGRIGTLFRPPTAAALRDCLLEFAADPRPFLAKARAGVTLSTGRTWRAAAQTMLDACDR